MKNFTKEFSMAKLYIDVGGTYIRSELHCDGQITYDEASSKDHDIFAYIKAVMDTREDIDFIGISYAGQVYDGVVLSSPNIEHEELDIQAKLEQLYKIEVLIENDLNCAVMAEATHFKTQNIAALFVGTGLGSAYIYNNVLVRGSTNIAFEIGHIPYKEAPFLCGCGRANCIELFASGSGMAKWLQYFKNEREVNLQDLKHSHDKNESMIAEEFEKAFLHAAGTLITIANPKLLVLGGGIIQKNRYLLTLLKESMAKYALHTSLIDLEIQISVLKNGALEGTKLLQERKYG